MKVLNLRLLKHVTLAAMASMPSFAMALTPAQDPVEVPQLGPAPDESQAREIWSAYQGRIRTLAEPGEMFTVDTSDRETVRLFFKSVYGASEGVDPEWTGSYAGAGDPGTTSAEWKEAVRLRLNFYRAMAGVPSWITFNATYNAKSQQAALMMSGEDALSHFPGLGWAYYTEDGAEAAQNSNLAIGSAGPDSITGFIEDYGGGNAQVGHRKWFLHPPHKVMGTGDVPGDPTHRAANSTWVFDGNTFNAYPTLRDGFVAWPPAGHVPYQLTFPRWSFGAEGANMSAATVTMVKGGQAVPVVINYQSSNTRDHLVWVPENLNPGLPSGGWEKPDTDLTYDVTISNVVIGGQTQEFNYSVTIFDPAVASPGAPATTLSGTDEPGVGQANVYSVSGPAAAEGFEWRHFQVESLNLNLSAATLDGLEVDVGGYDVLFNGESGAQGTVFKLARVPNDDSPQLLTIIGTLVPRPESLLRFDSKLGFATTTQYARVEISHDDGTSWTTVWEKQGTGGLVDNAFGEETVPLNAYVGQTILIRFAYVHAGQSFFPGGDNNVGWSIDNIRLIDTNRIGSQTINAADTFSNFIFVPPTTGTYYLQTRALAFGGFPLDWSNVLTVQAKNKDVGGGSPFSVYPDAGDGWRASALGWVNDATWPWVYHLQHANLFGLGTEAGMHFYDLNFGGWWYTSANVYPWIYDYLNGNWMQTVEGTIAPQRWFWVPGTGYVFEPDL